MLSLAISPCPNDTFAFHRLIAEDEWELTLGDVEELNRGPIAGKFDISKCSVAAYPWFKEGLRAALRGGGAAGYGVGPLLVANDERRPGGLIAIPGEMTTAAFLLRQLRDFDTVEMRFDRIEDAVISGDVDCGVLIHEGRFTYADKGLVKLLDMSDLWRGPLPLGAIAIRRSLGAELAREIDRRLRASVEHAFAHPEDSTDFVRAHAQEMDPSVIRSHIDLYVNDYTLELDPETVLRMVGAMPPRSSPTGSTARAEPASHDLHPALPDLDSWSPPEDSPYVVVLGVAQDGGFPQAGSESPAWTDESLRRRVTSIAVVDPLSDERFLFDATPDFRWQLRTLDELAPRTSPLVLDGIFLTHAHVGHYTGLIHLGREIIGTRDVPVWAMPRMHAFLTDNGPWSQLVALSNIDLRPLSAGRAVRLNERLRVTPIPVPHRDEFSETVGFLIEGPRRAVFFLPDIDKWEAWDRIDGAGAIERTLARCDVAYLDGSFYSAAEVPGRAMSEIPHPLLTESLARFPIGLRQKIRFIHLNRTNPALLEGSAERSEMIDAGFAFAQEGEIFGL